MVGSLADFRQLLSLRHGGDIRMQDFLLQAAPTTRYTLLPTAPLAGVKLVIVGTAPPAVSPPSHPVNVKACVYASIPTSPLG